jgi:hypothetical protein
MGEAGKLNGDNLILSRDDYLSIRNRFDQDLSLKKSIDLYKLIPYQVRLNGLQKHGLLIVEDEEITISSKVYPKMFPAMKALAESAKEVKTFGEQNFFTCEFRQIFKRYTPKYEDVIQTLNEPQKVLCDAVHAYLLSIGARPSCTTYWKVNYKYRGDQITQISTEGTTLRIMINGLYWWDGDVNILNQRLIIKGSDFQKYALRNLNYCTGCSTSHEGGGFVRVLGRKVRLCGSIGFRITNPDIGQYDYMKDMIRIRVEIINELNKKI